MDVPADLRRRTLASQERRGGNAACRGPDGQVADRLSISTGRGSAITKNTYQRNTPDTRTNTWPKSTCASPGR
jgi:hypothetical protein